MSTSPSSSQATAGSTSVATLSSQSTLVADSPIAHPVPMSAFLFRGFPGTFSPEMIKTVINHSIPYTPTGQVGPAGYNLPLYTVCSSLTQEIRDSPLCWTEVHVDTEMRQCSLRTLKRRALALKLQLERAGDSPLNIFFRGGGGRHIEQDKIMLQMLCSRAEFWGEATLELSPALMPVLAEIKGRLGALRYLSFNIASNKQTEYANIFLDTPSLIHLNLLPTLLRACFFLPFADITRLTTSWSAELYPALKAVRRLEYLNVASNPAGVPRYPKCATLVQSIVRLVAPGTLFLTTICTPILEELILDDDNEWEDDALFNFKLFMEGSEPELHKLTLTGSKPSPKLLVFCPKITTLVVTLGEASPLYDVLHALIEKDIVPELQNLYVLVDNCVDELSFRATVEIYCMLEERSKGALRSFRMTPHAMTRSFLRILGHLEVITPQLTVGKIDALPYLAASTVAPGASGLVWDTAENDRRARARVTCIQENFNSAGGSRHLNAYRLMEWWGCPTTNRL
ncbi:hypothetical protein B0H15DRAFT_958447 [Mycena belliarum]|uniref:Uncharacterized protein n=1 Tax=Mycena belliarum TaxID=1033014 RepID=A0AAD6TN71_9AGAR|nr:hypothetical protein B0H15DRAFT_958447 [Mycena belliae]